MGGGLVIRLTREQLHTLVIAVNDVREYYHNELQGAKNSHRIATLVKRKGDVEKLLASLGTIGEGTQ